MKHKNITEEGSKVGNNLYFQIKIKARLGTIHRSCSRPGSQ